MAWIYRPNHPQANENGLVEKHLVSQYRSNGSPYVISDTMEPMKHMGTGRILDSKAKFRADTKASGCVEIGNEPIKNRARVKLDSGQRREAIRKAFYDARNRK